MMYCNGEMMPKRNILNAQYKIYKMRYAQKLINNSPMTLHIEKNILIYFAVLKHASIFELAAIL